jgi:putative peptidoglycan lipid II flippase
MSDQQPSLDSDIPSEKLSLSKAAPPFLDEKRGGAALWAWLDFLPIPGGASRSISRAALTVAFFSALAMLASTGKEVLVASRFGRVDALDAFLIAFLVPFVVVRVAGGSFDSAFIPVFVSMRESSGPEAAQRVFSNALAAACIFLIGTAVLLSLLGRHYLPFLASSFEPEKLALTIRLHSLLSGYLVLGGLSLVIAGALNAQERFALPALAPFLTPLAIIYFILAFGSRMGIWTLAWGTLAGALMEVGLLARALKRAGLNPWPRWHGLDGPFRRVAAGSAGMAGAMVLLNGVLVLERSAAATLGGGSVAALNYGSKLVLAISSLAGMMLYAAVFPYFSQMAARGTWSEYRRTLRTCAILALLATVPMALAVAVFSRPLVEIVLERGAFSAADTRVVAAVQALYAIQIPFFVLAVPLTRALSSLGRNRVVLWGGAVALASGFVLYGVLSRLMGTPGVALATSLVNFILCVFLAVAILRVLPRGSHADEEERR